ncbi:MAG: hypothetical protein HUJ91_03565 [Bacteroidales bacterium]|nr:hypothetical protein [Bacteroidales bacterium]
MRRGISVGIAPLKVAIFFFFAAAACRWTSFSLYAQTVAAEALLEMAEEGLSEETAQNFIAEVEYLTRHPADLNGATRETLERLGVLSVFQTESLLEYIKDYGPILSWNEVGVVDGITADAVALLQQFFTLGKPAGTQRGTMELRSRCRYSQLHRGIGQYNRVSFSEGGLTGGALLESDAGEMPLMDFKSMYLAYSDGKGTFLLGDYSACFGQGLSLWSGFSLTSVSSPSSVMKRGRGIMPYRSCCESNYFRGVAASRKMGCVAVSLIFSAAPVDAAVKDGKYTSLATDGLHRTVTEKLKKGAMREYLGAADVTFSRNRLKAGVTLAAYGYNRGNGRKVQEYNRYQMYDGLWGNASFNLLWSVGHLRTFAEVALDMGLRTAALAGVVWSPSYGFEVSVTGRHYPYNYIASHAGAWSRSSAVANQSGLLCACQIRPNENLAVNLSSEMVHFPYSRFRVSGPSDAVWSSAAIQWEKGLWRWSVRDNFKWQSQDGSQRHSLKGMVGVKGAWCGLSCRMSSSVVKLPERELQCGFALGLDAETKFCGGRMSVKGGVTYYNTPDYDTRVYIYEPDLPGVFLANCHYGKGLAPRLVAEYRPSKNRRYMAKVSRADALSAESPIAAAVQVDFSF